MIFVAFRDQPSEAKLRHTCSTKGEHLSMWLPGLGMEALPNHLPCTVCVWVRPSR